MNKDVFQYEAKSFFGLISQKTVIVNLKDIQQLDYKKNFMVHSATIFIYRAGVLLPYEIKFVSNYNDVINFIMKNNK